MDHIISRCKDTNFSRHGEIIFFHVRKMSFFCSRFHKEITKRYAPTADMNVRNSIGMQRMCSGSRVLAWTVSISSFQGILKTSIRGSGTRHHASFIVAQRGTGERNKNIKQNEETKSISNDALHCSYWVGNIMFQRR